MSRYMVTLLNRFTDRNDVVVHGLVFIECKPRMLMWSAKGMSQPAILTVTTGKAGIPVVGTK